MCVHVCIFRVKEIVFCCINFISLYICTCLLTNSEVKSLRLLGKPAPVRIMCFPYVCTRVSAIPQPMRQLVALQAEREPFVARVRRAAVARRHHFL